MILLELLLDFLINILDFQFLKDLKKKRAATKENKLPQKSKLLPSTKIFMTVMSITLLFLFGLTSYKVYFGNPIKAQEKLNQVQALLQKEKEVEGRYPNQLAEIIRNNPLYKDITIDLWGNEYYYELLANGSNYKLQSKGKDGILNTKDDIVPSFITEKD